MKLRWFFWLFVIAFVWIVVSRFTEIRSLARILAQGRWEWVLLAALLQVGFYTLYTGIYQAAFYTVEVRSHIINLLPLTFASVFMNVAAPSAGASSLALFVDDATRRGQPGGRVAAGGLLVLLCDLLAFTLILIAGLSVLFSLNSLEPYEIAGALILLVLIGGLSGVLLLGVIQPGLLNRLLNWAQGMANRLARRLKRPPFLNEGWAAQASEEFSQAAFAITIHPLRLAWALFVALCAHLVDLASLYALFLAFHQPVSFGILVAGFSMGILFWVVSITPQGIGVVEAVMALVFSSLGIPADTATVIALAFRGLTFWVPFGLGFILLRRIQAFSAG